MIDHTAFHYKRQISPLERLFDQLPGTGVGRGQHTLVVGPLANLSAKNLQDTRRRNMIGQLRRVVHHQALFSGCGASAGHAVPPAQRGNAAAEHGRQPVPVLADPALGWLPVVPRALPWSATASTAATRAGPAETQRVWVSGPPCSLAGGEAL